MESNQGKLFEQLRKDFPEFVYEDFSYSIVHNELRIYFHFNLGDKYSFKPYHIFHLPANFNSQKLSDSLFRNLIFNLGMIELISYWKAACPPKLTIKAANLSNEQMGFWKKLYFYGLGEFFFLNGIKPGTELMEITCAGSETYEKASIVSDDPEAVMVPLGGGKDSVVTLELLSHLKDVRPYIMNPRTASTETAARAGFSKEDMIISKRSIDPLLLDLNAKGFLNGHTPFSAMLAFTTLIAAYLNNISEIALSNESSANEPTIPGTSINHQYSKSLEFENDFREYVSTYITDDIKYYSYLRPLNELQIAKIFSTFHQHRDSFRSCNVGSKTDIWCGQCSKCLFTCIILLPFLSQEELGQIFNRDLLNDESLKGLLEQLCGLTDEKPFECVGTIDDVNAAIRYFINKDPKGAKPKLVEHYMKIVGEYSGDESVYENLLKEFGVHNIPSQETTNILRKAINVD